MPKVKIAPADYDLFAARARAADLSVAQWLTATGRARCAPATPSASPATTLSASPAATPSTSPATPPDPRGTPPDPAGSSTGSPGAPAELWAATLSDCRGQIASRQERAFLQPTRLVAIVEGVALVSVPDAFTRDVIESRLRPVLTEALARRLGVPIQIAVRVDEPAPLPPGDVQRSTAQLGEPAVSDVQRFTAQPTEPAVGDVQRFTALLAQPAVARQVAEILAAATR
ncbi:hypothetical protein [Paractinoplanes pyxinae]|uniref:hypothetical protein n=1 Tax=Paractinoplanes pyxinae TaxID=2997416 RepID=UPI003F692E9F